MLKATQSASRVSTAPEVVCTQNVDITAERSAAVTGCEWEAAQVSTLLDEPEVTARAHEEVEYERDTAGLDAEEELVHVQRGFDEENRTSQARLGQEQTSRKRAQNLLNAERAAHRATKIDLEDAIDELSRVNAEERGKREFAEQNRTDAQQLPREERSRRERMEVELARSQVAVQAGATRSISR